MNRLLKTYLAGWPWIWGWGRRQENIWRQGGNEIKLNKLQSKHLWGGSNVQSRARTAIPDRGEVDTQQLPANTGLRLQPAPLLRAEHI